MNTTGFDNQLYIEKQTQKILERMDRCEGRLYLEFGGKLFDDYHAARVLPGFDLNGKAKLLQALSDRAEIILCINAGDIEKNKMRADLGITYDLDVLRLIDSLGQMDLRVTSVVITQYTRQSAADVFRRKLERRGVRTYLHRPTAGYPSETELIVSDQGYGKNPYIETTMPIVVVTAPGPGSGKLATCLSQLYHEYRRGNKAGYAKFETFPIWNLPLSHPVNIAYEAATSDLNDVNMIDPFYLETTGETAVNYNRDIAAFPIVKTLLTRITGDSVYDSPTDMGVNMAGYAITDDEACQKAAAQEVIRRYYDAQCNFKKGLASAETVAKNQQLMNQMGLTSDDRATVGPALKKARKSGKPAMAIELPDGTIITGRRTDLMLSGASVILNAIKHLANIADSIPLLSHVLLEPILRMKQEVLSEADPLLTVEDVLLALALGAATNPTAAVAMDKLSELRGCDAHSSCMLTQADESAMRRLGLRITCEPNFPSDSLYFV